MKLRAFLPSVIGVMLLIIAVFYAQTESMRSEKHEFMITKSTRGL